MSKKTDELNRPVSRHDAYSWVRRVVKCEREIEKQWDSLASVTNATLDSPLGNAVWKTLDSLIDAVEAVLDPHSPSILSWYVWENDCGSKGLSHINPSGEMVSVKCIDDLLGVMGY